MDKFAGWSGTAIGSMKKNESVPHIRTFKENQTLITNHDDLEYETWMSSCITLGALAGSLIAGSIASLVILLPC